MVTTTCSRWAILTEWSSGPFAATIQDGKLYARGAANSKGDLVARLAAVEAYQKTFGKLPVTLAFHRRRRRWTGQSESLSLHH